MDPKSPPLFTAGDGAPNKLVVEGAAAAIV